LSSGKSGAREISGCYRFRENANGSVWWGEALGVLTTWVTHWLGGGVEASVASRNAAAQPGLFSVPVSGRSEIAAFRFVHLAHK